jgi:hypothetical protein
MKLQSCLSSATQSRVFKVDRILPTRSAGESTTIKQSAVDTRQSITGSSGTKVHESKMVRSDYKVKTLDSFLKPSQGMAGGSAHERMFGDSHSGRASSQSFHRGGNSQDDVAGSQRPGSSQTFDQTPVREDPMSQSPGRGYAAGSTSPFHGDGDTPMTQERKFVKVQLNSVLNLLKLLDEETSPEFTELIRSHVFVGLIDDSRGLVQVYTYTR